MRYKEVATICRVRLISIFMSPSFFSLFQILGIIMCVGVSPVSYIIIFHTLGQLHSRVQNYGSEEGAGGSNITAIIPTGWITWLNTDFPCPLLCCVLRNLLHFYLRKTFLISRQIFAILAPGITTLVI